MRHYTNALTQLLFLKKLMKVAQPKPVRAAGRAGLQMREYAHGVALGLFRTAQKARLTLQDN